MYSILNDLEDNLCLLNGSIRLTAVRLVGPCSAVEMKHLASTGKILPTYRVQRKGRAKTVMAQNVKGLFQPKIDPAA